MLNYKIIGSRLRILLIGPVTNYEKNLVGGATISFGYLKEYLEKSHHPFTLINTKSYPKGVGKLLNPFIVIFNAVLRSLSNDVIFLNSSRGGTKYLAPLLFLLSRITGSMFVYRPFGGDIKDYTAKYSRITNWIFEQTVLMADILFLQTYQLMDYYKDDANCHYLPTSRNSPSEILTNRAMYFRKRFIFIGFVTPDKGIEELMDASGLLDDSYTVHIYGPIKSSRYAGWETNPPEIYKGILKNDAVLERMSDYDVLVLPTYYEGEGYPGVIIEAYSLGMPVITTDWAAIPEIVEDKVTGRVINIRSSNALVDAIQSFNDNNYKEYSKNARSIFDRRFEAKLVGNMIIESIETKYKK